MDNIQEVKAPTGTSRDAIDEALDSGEARGNHSGAYQVGKHEIPGAEVDRWRKLRALENVKQCFTL